MHAHSHPASCSWAATSDKSKEAAIPNCKRTHVQAPGSFFARRVQILPLTHEQVYIRFSNPHLAAAAWPSFGEVAPPCETPAQDFPPEHTEAKRALHTAVRWIGQLRLNSSGLLQTSSYRMQKPPAAKFDAPNSASKRPR